MISLDYELAWGTYEMTSVAYCRESVVNANDAAERLVDLHERLQAPITWAVVGAAVDPAPLRDRIERSRANGAPMEKFEAYVRAVPPDQLERVTCIPSRIVERITTSGMQEIASHSYAHLYADSVSGLEYAQDFVSFDATIRQLGVVAPAFFVAPKNLVTEDIRRLAAKHGFRVVRVNPSNWLYRLRSRGGFVMLLVRALRFVDAFLPLNECFELAAGHAAPEPSTVEGNFFFRPVLPLRILERLHFWRFKTWVAFAVRSGRDVHLWSHPHNFGADMPRALRNYERVLQYMQSASAAHRIPFVRASEIAG